MGGCRRLAASHSHLVRKPVFHAVVGGSGERGMHRRDVGSSSGLMPPHRHLIVTTGDSDETHSRDKRSDASEQDGNVRLG